MDNKKFSIEECSKAFEEFKVKYNLTSHLFVGVFDTTTEPQALNSVEVGEELLQSLAGITFINKDFRRILEDTIFIANEIEEKMPLEDKEKFIKENSRNINN